jgi:hypothetical protein
MSFYGTLHCYHPPKYFVMCCVLLEDGKVDKNMS